MTTYPNGNGAHVEEEQAPESDRSEAETIEALQRRIRELESERAIDTVTNLPRRAVIAALVATQIKHRRPFALVFCDVDGLKQANDTHGHAAGDDLLVRVAETLSANVREATGDFVARWGGDEFLVLLNSPEDPYTAAARLRAAVCEAVANFGAGLSVGVATHPEDGDTVSALVRVADGRMYAAKRAGKASR
jgi:diguanylate cyclase (GGDEF)-like protein